MKKNRENLLYIKRSIIFFVVGIVIGLIIAKLAINGPNKYNSWSNKETLSNLALYFGYILFSFYAGLDFLIKRLGNPFVLAGFLLGGIYLGFIVILSVIILPLGMIISVPKFIIKLIKYNNDRAVNY